jgi:Prohead core protein serine protease
VQNNVVSRSPITLLEAFVEGHGLLIEADAGFVSADLNPNLGRMLHEASQALPGQEGKYPPILLRCLLQKANATNRNGRIYPKEVLQKVVREYEELVRTNSAAGEANHPNDTTVNLDRISHRVTKIWWEGDNVMGEIELFVSPQYRQRGEISTALLGDRIAYYLEQGMRIGISSRGLGSVKQVRGQHIVQNDYMIFCWDIVHSPSVPGAWLMPQTSSPTSLSESTKDSIIMSNHDERVRQFLNRSKNRN